ncbi:hypothetical protein GYMLUDRAFT_779696 [Collybiopsis luxurians FD-317 M1]|uniref:Uncharacterized protein n=1 Tax=Collybiopsis luxurians FD-317 M1 TaxID=944289 RepID=A0A0D0B0P2_9AGAR|nr:hypothetical protein GYMLUDRAFT_779696 [Collybiopsis luxurians FD-317 M1]
MDSSSSSSSSAATKMVQERNDMIEALYSTLPSVERALLDAEIKGKPMFGFGIPSTTTQAAANAGPSGDTTMSDSQSWDEIHRHEVPGSGVAVNGVNAAEVTGRSMPAASTSTSVTAVKDPIPPSVPTTAAAFGVSTNFTVPSSFSLSGSQSSAPLASAERESLASSRAGAPRFGGAPPILPISSGAGGGGSGGALNLSSGSGFGGIPSLNPNLNLSSGLGGGRKSLPFNSSAFNMLNTSTALSSSTSGAGAAANANQQQQQNPLSFSSSKRKPNAFYKPPPAVNDDAMPNPFSVAPVQSGVSARSPERQPRRNKGAGVDVGMSEDEVAGAMQVDDEDGTQGRDPNARGEGGLGYSLFANHSETLSSADRGRPSTGRGRKSLGFSATSATRGGVAKAAADRGNLNDSLSLSTGSSSSKKRPRPPGAFIVDGEEDEDEDEDDVDMDTVQELPSRSQLPPLQIPTRQTRSSRKSTAPAATSISAASGRSTALSAGSGAGPSVSASTASRVTSTSRGRVKKARTTTTKSSKKTVPGAMFEDDEGDREESDAQSQSQSEGGWSPQQTRSRRGGASNRGKGQARARKEKELSVDEGDEGEEEEQDRVAPLGAAATRSGRTTTRATRKTRGSTAASLDSNEDGGVETGTRRRSSRISTVGSAGADGGSRKSTRKSVVGGASTTTGRRKTRT